MLRGGVSPALQRQWLEALCGACHRHRLSGEAQLLRMAHSACHSDRRFIDQVNAHLDALADGAIAEIAGAGWLAAARRAVSDPHMSALDRTAVAWALLTDPAPDRPPYGGLVVHLLFVSGGAAAAPPQPEVECQLDALRRELRSKQAQIDAMLAYIHRTRRAVHPETLAAAGD